MLKEMFDDYVEDTNNIYESCVRPDGTMNEEDYEYWHRRVNIQETVAREYQLQHKWPATLWCSGLIA